MRIPPSRVPRCERGRETPWLYCEGGIAMLLGTPSRSTAGPRPRQRLAEASDRSAISAHRCWPAIGHAPARPISSFEARAVAPSCFFLDFRPMHHELVPLFHSLNAETALIL